MSEPALRDAVTRILSEPSVCAVAVLDLQPGVLSGPIAREECPGDATPVALEAPRLYLYVGSFHIDNGENEPARRALDTAAAGYTRRQDAVGLLEVSLRQTFALIRQSAFQQAGETVAKAIERNRVAGLPTE